MKTLLLFLLLGAVPDAGVKLPPAPREAKLEALKRAPVADGVLRESASSGTWGTVVGSSGPQDQGAHRFSAQAGWYRDRLYVGLDVQDATVATGDEAVVSLAFPEAGPLAEGRRLRMGRSGLRQDDSTPEHAQRQVQAGVKAAKDSITFELVIPARALPRFPATGPMRLELCASYTNQQASGTPVQNASECPAGGQTQAFLIPPTFRTALGLRPPKAVIALEPAPTGWLGYSDAPHPVWVQADSPLTRDSLQTLFAPDLDPQSASLKAPLPPWVTLSDGRRLLLVLSGRSPFREEGACSPGTEARLGLFLVDKSGRAATRVLDWSAANCELGRVLSVALDDENALEVGYSGGAQVRFVWVGDHFERTDIG